MSGLILSSSEPEKKVKKIIFPKPEPTEISATLEGINHGIDNALLQAIKNAITNENEAKALELFDQLHHTDQAILFSLLKGENKDRLMLYVLNYNFNPYFFTELNNSLTTQFIHFFGYKKAASLLDSLPHDDIINFMSALSLGDQLRLLKRFSHEDRKAIRKGLNYPERAAGRIMDLEYAVVTAGVQISQVFDYIRLNINILPDRIYDIFVVNEEHKLTGIASLMDIIKADPNAKIDSIIKHEVSIVNDMDDKSEVLYLFNKYDINTAPVLDKDGHLVGVISVDNVRYLATEEAEEEAMKMRGVLSDLDEGIFQTTKIRFIWLFINLVTAGIASYVIHFFEETIHAITALAVLMPILVSMGCNGGTQTIAVVIRAIATKDLNKNTFSKYFSREMTMSAINGFIIFIICSLIVYILYHKIGLALVFGASILAAMIVGGMVGVIAPIVMKKLGTDPAVTAVVFLTTIVDIASFAVFLWLAKFFLL